MIAILLILCSVVLTVIGAITGKDAFFTQSIVCIVGFFIIKEINKPRT